MGIYFVRSDKYDMIKVYEDDTFIQQYPLGMLSPQKISMWEKGKPNSEIQLIHNYSANTKPLHSFAIAQIEAEKCVPIIQVFPEDMEKTLDELNALFCSELVQVTAELQSLLDALNNKNNS